MEPLKSDGRGYSLLLLFAWYEGHLHSMSRYPRKQSLKIAAVFLCATMLISHARWQFFAYTPIVNSFDVQLDFDTVSAVCCSGRLFLFIVKSIRCFSSLSQQDKKREIHDNRPGSCKTVCYTIHLQQHDKSNEIHNNQSTGFWYTLGAVLHIAHK